MLFVSDVLIALAGIVISYFILNRHRRSSVKTLNALSGPKAFPLIGNAYYFFRRSSDEFLNIIIELTDNYLSPFKLWMGHKLFIVIHEPEEIQVILQNTVEKSTVYKFVEPIFGSEGLLTVPELTWIKNRKIVAPNFSTIALRKFFDVFVEQSLILTDQLEKIGLSRKKIILHNHIAKYTLSTSCRTITNIKMESLSNEIDQCLEVITSLRKSFKTRLRNPFLYFNLIFNLTAMGREQRKNINFIHSFINKIMQQHMYALNAQNTNIKCETTNKTLLHILLEKSHKDKDSQEMIYDNLITMILAAFDTTAVTLEFAIFMLANFPSIQEKVYQELWQIYETKTPKSAPLKYEDLQHMNYLDRVIKETLRLFPAAPLIGRYLTKDIKMGECILPKNTEIVLVILALHRNEKYWPNPLIFDPDRFLPEKIGTSYKYYMPFSYGPRNCIGMKYAMILMKVILSILIRTFVFKVEKNTRIDAIKLDMDITLRTTEPMEVIIEKRELH